MSVSLLSPLAPLPGGLPHSESCSLALNRDDIQAQPLPQPLPGSQILMYNSSSIDLQIDTLSVPQVQVKLITLAFPSLSLFFLFVSFLSWVNWFRNLGRHLYSYLLMSYIQVLTIPHSSLLCWPPVTTIVSSPPILPTASLYGYLSYMQIWSYRLCSAP